MKNLLYIGNQLEQKGKTQTTIDSLSLLLRQEGYGVITASKKTNKILRLLDMLWHIFKYRTLIDYVLIDTYSTQNFYYAVLCGRLCEILKLKYIPILHGGHLEQRLLNSPKLSTKLFCNAYVNIAPSEYLYRLFKHYGYSNLEIIPNSIEIENYAFKKRIFDVPKLLWVRSFAEIYNPLLAVKILKILREEGFDAKLCMVGPDKDGTLHKVKLFAKQLDLQVEFPGKLSKMEWIKLSDRYNIFINTTNFDNMPVSVIESMALGLPIVSTNVGGVPFLILHGYDGLLVDTNNEYQFVDAIKSLISSSYYANNLSNNARNKIEKFDWKVIKNKWNIVLN